MLALVEQRAEKLEAHKKLASRLSEGWPNRARRTVVWRPDSREMNVHHNGSFWFGFVRPDPQDKTPRFWNAFGEYRPVGNLHISVEMNIPTESNTHRVAGFFAKDLASGETYLMHDGGVGGGKKGVGKTTFLAWSNARLVEVGDADGDMRPAIIVAPVDSAITASDIGRFVQKALDFKKAVANGETSTQQARQAQQTYQDYFDEFSGKKKRPRIAEVEYISRHGDIVRALHAWRNLSPEEEQRAVKNAFIDLGVVTGDVLTELYEVKTNSDRQTLYSAIGQMLVHDELGNNGCKRVLVLPEGESVPHDIGLALQRANISLLRFSIHGERVSIVD